MSRISWLSDRLRRKSFVQPRLASLLLCCRLLLAAQTPAAQPPDPSATPDNQRLLTIARLWTTVEYFHPYLAYQNIDWDRSLIDALPRLRAAKDSASYQAALSSMLDALHDPASFVSSKAQSVDASLLLDKKPDGTLIVSQIGLPPNIDSVKQLAAAIPSASHLIFDLRVPVGAPDFLSNSLDDPAIAGLLSNDSLDSPGQRTWVHNGLPPESGQDFGGYYSAFSSRGGHRIAGTSKSASRRLAFLLNENSPLPELGAALLAAGKANVFAESPHYQIRGVDTVAIDMGLDTIATVRLSEPVVPLHIIPVEHPAALNHALESVSSVTQLPPLPALPLAPSPRPAHSYADTPYPTSEYRILAAFKIWATFRNFFAYRDLMDEDWDDDFAVYLPKIIAAKDAREYNLTISEMVARVSDCHAFIESDELTSYFGAAPAGLRLRLIEKKAVITEVLDPAAKTADIQPGDIVTGIDGEDARLRINREARYIASSTNQWLGFRVTQRLLDGPDGSSVALAIENRNGETRSVSLVRRAKYVPALDVQRNGDVVKLLPGNIGYADLDRLLPDQVDSMFAQFQNTKAIVFDMRGYPHGTAWDLAPRLTDKDDVGAAIFTGPIAAVPDLPRRGLLTATSSYFFVQKLPPPNKSKPVYKGKTVMLIDERTISQAEHTGLFLKAANNTEFIGTASAGADGDVTNFVVPGGITIYFSGHDVRAADGGKLQRLGLQPSLKVPTTIADIRAGRDEVLDKAVEYLSR